MIARTCALGLALILTAGTAWAQFQLGPQRCEADPNATPTKRLAIKTGGTCGCAASDPGCLVIVVDATAADCAALATDPGQGDIELLCQREDGAAATPYSNVPEPARQFVDDPNCSVGFVYEDGIAGWLPAVAGCGDRSSIKDGHVVQIPNANDGESPVTCRGPANPQNPATPYGSTTTRCAYDARSARYLPTGNYEACLDDPDCDPHRKAFLETIHPPDRITLSREVTFFGGEDLIDGSCTSPFCRGWSFFGTNTTVAYEAADQAHWHAAAYTVGTQINDGFSICQDGAVRVRDVLASDGTSGMHGGYFQPVIQFEDAANAEFFVGMSVNGCSQDFFAHGTMGVDVIGFWMASRQMWTVARSNAAPDFDPRCANCTSKQTHETGAGGVTYPAGRHVTFRIEVDHHYGARFYVDGALYAWFPPGTANLNLQNATYTVWVAFRRLNTNGSKVRVLGLKNGIYAPQ